MLGTASAPWLPAAGAKQKPHSTGKTGGPNEKSTAVLPTGQATIAIQALNSSCLSCQYSDFASESILEALRRSPSVTLRATLLPKMEQPWGPQEEGK